MPAWLNNSRILQSSINGVSVKLSTPTMRASSAESVVTVFHFNHKIKDAFDSVAFGLHHIEGLNAQIALFRILIQKRYRFCQQRVVDGGAQRRTARTAGRTLTDLTSSSLAGLSCISDKSLLQSHEEELEVDSEATTTGFTYDTVDTDF
uniref:Uncharacterized protein n=1 Tax=Cannabis sativa TaxID=3483 RepID=A0A803PTA0_CANSA